MGVGTRRFQNNINVEPFRNRTEVAHGGSHRLEGKLHGWPCEQLDLSGIADDYVGNLLEE